MKNRAMRLVLLIAALCVFGTAWAADNANGPGNFRLLAPCSEAGGGVTSTCTLVGEATVDGRVIYRYSHIWGMYALFVVSADSMPLLPDRFRVFRLANADLDRFRLPRLDDYLPRLDDDRHECYSANARIKITKLRYPAEGGTVLDGAYLGEYEVMSLYNVESHRCGWEREWGAEPPPR